MNWAKPRQARLKITKTDAKNLPSCNPYLMPFHIDYNGPASVSTYMNIKPVSEEPFGGSPSLNVVNERKEVDASGSMQIDLTIVEDPGYSKVDENMETNDVDDQKENITGKLEDTTLAPPSQGTLTDISNISAILAGGATTSTSSSPPTPPSIPQIVKKTAERFISSFRGRIIQGLKVDVPDGYHGVVFRAPKVGGGRNNVGNNNTIKGRAEASKGNKGKEAALPTSKKNRMTRSTRRIVRADQEEDEVGKGMEIDDVADRAANDSEPMHDDLAWRELAPSAKFSSFVLWHADIPVDEGRDEYFRAINEWTRLAEEIHRVDD